MEYRKTCHIDPAYGSMVGCLSCGAKVSYCHTTERKRDKRTGKVASNGTPILNSQNNSLSAIETTNIHLLSCFTLPNQLYYIKGTGVKLHGRVLDGLLWVSLLLFCQPKSTQQLLHNSLPTFTAIINPATKHQHLIHDHII